MAADAEGDDLYHTSIIIPVFNQAFFTRVCLTSLEPARGAAEVIVVDNGSVDSTPRLLQEWAACGNRRRVVRFEENLGFGPACNAGADAASGDHLVFLNNDTFVLPSWLGPLIRPLADPTITVTGSCLLYPNGSVQHAGVAFNALGPWHVFVGLPGDSPLVMEERDYQAVTGASLAIRTVAFHRLGGFDDAYRNAFEDIDLCLRAREEGGRVVYVPDSVAYHFEAMSEGRAGQTDKLSYEVFMRRWQGRFQLDIEVIKNAARASGYDLEQRSLTRRELMDFESNFEARAQELKELRTIASMRSVRAALWARGLYRKILA